MSVMTTSFLHYISSLLLTVYLMNWLLVLMNWLLVLFKRKTIPLRHYQFNTIGKVTIFFCFCFNLYVIFYLKEFYISDLVKVVVLSFIFLLLTQRCGYSRAEINSCLKDSESIGAYWAHQAYNAYYKLVLEDIKDRMMLFEKEENIHIFFKKLIIIIPLSCNAEGTLTDRDDTIKKFGDLNPIENDQGANVNRTYKNVVYRVFEDTHIVAEFSFPVSALWKSRFEMEKEKISYIRDCYIKTLKCLIKGSPAIVIEYDDDGNCPKTLSDCILSSIKKENNYFI